jgi:nitrate reductase NapE component
MVIELALHIVLFGIGLVMAALAIAQTAQTLYLLVCWQRGTGTVIGHKRREGHFLPRVQYCVDGKPLTLVASAGRGIRSYRVGDRVPILYDPARPERAELATFLVLWFFPLALAILSVPFIWGSGFHLWTALIQAVATARYGLV